MTDLPFSHRLGFVNAKPIDNEFPENARIALAYLVSRLVSNHYVDMDQVYGEVLRIGRFSSFEYLYPDQDFFYLFLEKVNVLSWYQVYVFCERIFPFLRGTEIYDENGCYLRGESLEKVQKFYHDELNNLLYEENLAYRFEASKFYRKGYRQTQLNVTKAFSILSDPKLYDVRIHFNKANKYFSDIENVDYQNAIKEAVSALEAMVSVTFGKSRNFEKNLNDHSGNDKGKIPPPIKDIMSKLYAYRGSGQGVAHAALDGNRVGKAEAELALSISAALITYLNEYRIEEDIPF